MSEPRTLRIATRGSPLARAQSGQVASQLEATLGLAAELVLVRTTGDRILDQPLAAIGGKGLFVKEIEEALLDGRADVAIHSAKDLPARLAPGLALAAFPERADPRDACVGRTVGRLAELPQGARVGTGSVRRTSQLLAWRGDLEVVPLRGNVDTRLAKLESEALDAVILACAGLDRLGLADRVSERVDPRQLLPAVGQGTLALETRADDSLRDALAAVDHAPSRARLTAERAFLARLEGDCSVPLAAFAELTAAGQLRLRGLVASPDGAQSARAEAEAPPSDAAELGESVAEAVLEKGGAGILSRLAGASP